MAHNMMNSEYLAELILLEHSYVKTPNLLKAKFTKLPTRSLFKEKNEMAESLEIRSNSFTRESTTKYYSLALIELQALNSYFKCDANKLFVDDNFNDLTGSNMHIEIFDKASKIIKSYGCCVQKFYQKSGYSETSLRTHRIFTEYFGRKFMLLLLSVFEKKDIISWVINALIQFLNESYFLSFFELLVYSKNQIPNLSSCLFYRNGLFRIETNRTICDSRYSLENFAKLVEIMWSPIIQPLYSLNYNNSSLSILIIPPIPFCVKSNTLEQEMDFQLDDQIWLDRFVAIKRNIAHIGRIVTYKTESLHSSQSNDEDALKFWLDNLAYNLHSRIVSLKNREPSASLVLVGWLTGASLAYKLYVSNPKSIQCLILINLPTFDVNHKTKKWPLEDINAIKCPILFITSSDSKVSNPSDIEELRSSLNTPSALLVAESCDDLLLMNINEKLYQNMPQDLIDLKFIEAFRDFISLHHSNRQSYDPPPNDEQRRHSLNSDYESSQNESTSQMDSSQVDRSEVSTTQRFLSSGARQNMMNIGKKGSDQPIKKTINFTKNASSYSGGMHNYIGRDVNPKPATHFIPEISKSKLNKLLQPNQNILNETKNQAIVKNIYYEY